MKAHVIENLETKTMPLTLNGKTYDVACSCHVLKKLEKMPEEATDVEQTVKMVTWMINDSLERQYYPEKPKDDELVTEEYVEYFITAQNLKAYRKLVIECLDGSLPDDEGEEAKGVITDEMKEMFGEEEPEKNTIAE